MKLKRLRRELKKTMASATLELFDSLCACKLSTRAVLAARLLFGRSRGVWARKLPT